MDKPEKIKICVVSPLYHPSLGGLGKQAKLLTERLAKEGVRAFVISRKMSNLPPAEYSKKVHVIRAWSLKPEIYYLPGVSILNVLISLSFSISCAYNLYKKRKEYDIVHFHGASLPLIINLPLLKLLGKKVVAKIAAAGLGTEVGSFRGRFLGIGNFLAFIAKKADLFIATTNEIREGLLRDGIPSEKILRITNFIDTESFFPITRGNRGYLKKLKGLDNLIIVLYSGRFVRRKGVEILLKAWKEASRNRSNSKLLLLGEGPLLNEMKGLTKRIGLTESVQFMGHVSNVVEFLHMADIFVLPSLQEGMPNALLEAMACGLPVIGTRIGGVVDIIDDRKNGILIEPGNVKSLARALGELLENESLRNELGERAYEKIKREYSLDTVVGKYIQLYSNLLEA